MCQVNYSAEEQMAEDLARVQNQLRETTTQRDQLRDAGKAAAIELYVQMGDDNLPQGPYERLKVVTAWLWMTFAMTDYKKP